MNTLRTPHGNLSLPVFLPDATKGVIRALDSKDVEECGIEGLMVNSLHLSDKPGTTLIGREGTHYHLRGGCTEAHDDDTYQERRYA